MLRVCVCACVCWKWKMREKRGEIWVGTALVFWFLGFVLFLEKTRERRERERERQRGRGGDSPDDGRPAVGHLQRVGRHHPARSERANEGWGERVEVSHESKRKGERRGGRILFSCVLFFALRANTPVARGHGHAACGGRHGALYSKSRPGGWGVRSSRGRVWKTRAHTKLWTFISKGHEKQNRRAQKLFRQNPLLAAFWAGVLYEIFSTPPHHKRTHDKARTACLS